MLRPIDTYFLQKDEPAKSRLLFLRSNILIQDPNLWTHKKYQQPYIGIVEGKRIDHPYLTLEKRQE